MYLSKFNSSIGDILLLILLHELWVWFDVLSFFSMNSFESLFKYGKLVYSCTSLGLFMFGTNMSCFLLQTRRCHNVLYHFSRSTWFSNHFLCVTSSRPQINVFSIPQKIIQLPLETCFIVLVGQLCWPWIMSKSLSQVG